jgi:hypothetical protein
MIRVMALAKQQEFHTAIDIHTMMVRRSSLGAAEQSVVQALVRKHEPFSTPGAVDLSIKAYNS